MKSLLLILGIGLLSYSVSDIKSPGFIDGFLFPVIFGISVLVLICLLFSRAVSSRKGNRYTSTDSGGGSFGFGDNGGDGGGDCGGSDGGGCGGD